VTVANSDTPQTGAGASWDYSTKLGADNMLTSNEVSLARTLRFNNPNNEAFTVTFNVIGNLPRSSSSAAAASGSASSGENATSGSGGTTTTSGTLTSAVFKLTYSPLLNTVTVQLVKP
jgi:hypothetical protein